MRRRLVKLLGDKDENDGCRFEVEPLAIIISGVLCYKD